MQTQKNLKSIILKKNSSENEIKIYFEKVLELSQSNQSFPVNLDEVWMLVYYRKEEAVRTLKENFIESIDYQVLRKNAENPKGGRPSNIYLLSVPCLEYFIARKIRIVFDVYRRVFHNAAQYLHSDTKEIERLKNKNQELFDVGLEIYEKYKNSSDMYLAEWKKNEQLKYEIRKLYQMIE